MKQIWPNYSYSPATNVLTLTGLNIDRDQLLLVTAADRGRIMYNFADSSVTASAFTSGANTALTLVATTAGLTTTAALVIYYDDQLQSTSVSISNLPSTQTIAGTVTVGNSIAINYLPTVSGVQDGDGNIFGLQRDFPISGTVTANVGNPSAIIGGGYNNLEEFAASGGIPVNLDASFVNNALPISGTVTVSSLAGILTDLFASETIAVRELPALSAGTNRIGVVTIGAGTVTIGAGTAQIGSVTVGNSVTIASLPALVAGTAQIGSVTASISNSVTIVSLPAISGTVTANTFALQGTAVTTSNFTSTTASTVLANFNATREVLTIFNEGAGNLHVCAGATCTTIAYQVRLSAGDYYEVPNHQTTITHSAVFATAGTARVCQVS